MSNTPRRRRRTLVGNQRTRRRRRTIVKSRSSDPLSGFDFSSPRNSRREANIYRRASKKKLKRKKRKTKRKHKQKGAGNPLGSTLEDINLNQGTILGAAVAESLSNKSEFTEDWEPLLVALGATAGNKIGNKIITNKNPTVVKEAQKQ